MLKLPAFYVVPNRDHQMIDEGTVAITCYNGASITTASYTEALRFLIEQPTNLPKDIPRVVWNLADFIAALKRVLPAQYVADLESDQRRATWEEGEQRYRIFYQLGKFLGVHAGRYGDETTFYELDQFFPQDAEITCVEDVQRLTDELAAVFQSVGVSKITNLKSPVAVIEESGLLDEVYKTIPDPGAIPTGCMEFATYTDAWGAWCSAYQVGYWEKAYSYDMASCYPSLASKLLSLEGAKIVQSRKMLYDARYGFVKGKLFINPDHPWAFASPIVGPIDREDIGNPVGSLKEDYYTLGQVKFIERAGMGRFELNARAGGWFIYPQSTAMPFAAVMEDYYRKRAAGDLANMVCKRVIDGIIGRMGQYIQDKPTVYTNPVYHSLIRNTASIMLAMFIQTQNITKNELLHVNTDGLHTSKEIDLPRKVNAMGQWRSEEPGTLVVLSPEVVLEGPRCECLVEAIKADQKATVYMEEFDLQRLRMEQNRYFPQYPESGSTLLRRQYKSEAVRLL